MELKISESTKGILDQYQGDINAAETAVSIAKKAANDILNVILFEAGFNPNHIKNLKILDDHFAFDLKVPMDDYQEVGDKPKMEHEVDFRPMDSKEIEEAINDIPND